VSVAPTTPRRPDTLTINGSSREASWLMGAAV
jgi:hypothetical protein